LNAAPRLMVEEIVAEGDRVAGRWTFEYTPPELGKPVTFVGLDICRFVDGKIAERWWSMDMLGVLQQTGVIPPPAREGS